VEDKKSTWKTSFGLFGSACFLLTQAAAQRLACLQARPLAGAGLARSCSIIISESQGNLRPLTAQPSACLAMLTKSTT